MSLRCCLLRHNRTHSCCCLAFTGGTVGHAIVWDGWRGLLFLGPGAFDDRGLDGAILVDKEDQASLARMRAC